MRSHDERKWEKYLNIVSISASHCIFYAIFSSRVFTQVCMGPDRASPYQHSDTNNILTFTIFNIATFINWRLTFKVCLDLDSKTQKRQNKLLNEKETYCWTKEVIYQAYYHSKLCFGFDSQCWQAAFTIVNNKHKINSLILYYVNVYTLIVSTHTITSW